MRVITHLLLWKLGLAEATTQTTPAERACLGRHAAGRRRVIEIGVWHGVTSKVLLNAMAPAGEFFAVDPYPKGRFGFSAQRVIAHHEVGTVNGGRQVTWIEQTGAAAAAVVGAGGSEPVDMVFIDGDHSYQGIRADWEGFSSLVGPGGIMAMHDSRSHPGRDITEAGSARFTREVILADPQFERVDEVDSLTVVRRKA